MEENVMVVELNAPGLVDTSNAMEFPRLSFNIAPWITCVQSVMVDPLLGPCPMIICEIRVGAPSPRPDPPSSTTLKSKTETANAGVEAMELIVVLFRVPATIVVVLEYVTVTGLHATEPVIIVAVVELISPLVSTNV